MDKKNILNNVDSLTAEQLFDFILKGTVTRREIENTQDLDVTKRKKIDYLQSQFELKDDKAWGEAQYGNETSLRDYITKFPAGKYVEIAKSKIQEMDQLRRDAQAQKQEILHNLRKDSNIYHIDDIINFLNNGAITTAELINSGIPHEIVVDIRNVNYPDLQLGQTPDSIPEGYTEVYFWGMPGSGKTCSLAAILSTTEKAGYLDIATSPSYDYMTKLKNIFVDKNATLPIPTPVETTQYLPFTIKKAGEKYARSVSLIELSGEIFKCFFYKNAGKKFPTQSHQDTFDTLLRYLEGKNRKIHFFFIDYNKENKKDQNEYTQSDYLSAASTFFKGRNIFGKTTDAIYIVVTKSDLMPCHKDERVAFSKQYLQSNNFAAFINTLKDRCKENSINAGRLTVEPFSLGKVYFKDICHFDSSSANRIIDILNERIPPSKKSILDIFNR